MSLPDRKFIAAGIAGSIIAAICCITSVLVMSLGSLGLFTWITKPDLLLISALVLLWAVFAYGRYLRRQWGGRRTLTVKRARTWERSI